jgi:hypothetical protein
VVMARLCGRSGRRCRRLWRRRCRALAQESLHARESDLFVRGLVTGPTHLPGSQALHFAADHCSLRAGAACVGGTVCRSCRRCRTDQCADNQREQKAGTGSHHDPFRPSWGSYHGPARVTIAARTAPHCFLTGAGVSALNSACC